MKDETTAAGYVRPFLEVADSLRGSYADNVRHMYARAAFMGELRVHPRVVSTFHRWGEETGIYAAAKVYAKTRDDLARSLGLTQRSELILGAREDMPRDDFSHLLAPMADDPLAIRRLKQRIKRCEEGARAFGRTLDRKSKRQAQDAASLSREILKPGWPWVPIELIDEFFRHVHSFCLGAAIQRVWSVDERDDAPKVTIPAFETLEGESRKDAKRRLRASYIVAMATLAARPPAVPRGRVPRRKVDEIKRNARWFYRNRVLGESISSIARAYHAENCGSARHDAAGDRKHVRERVREAERLLSLTSWGWREGDQATSPASD